MVLRQLTDRRLIVLFAILLFTWGTPSNTRALRTLVTGDTIKDYEVTLLPGGNTKRLSELCGSRGLLLIFWATWSDRSLGLLTFAETDLKEKYGEAGVQIVGINVEGQAISDEDRGKIDEARKKLSLSIPLGINHGLVMFDEIGVITTPTTILVDEKLVMKGSYPGFPTIARNEIPEMLNNFLDIVEDKPPLRVQYLLDHKPKNNALLSYNYGKTIYKRYLSLKGDLKHVPEDSLKQLNRANEKDPDFYAPYLLKAVIFHKVREEAKKQEILGQIEGKHFQEPLEKIDLAYMFYLIDMKERAGEILGQLKEEAPEEKEVMLLEALLLFSDGKDEEAGPLIRELIEREEVHKDLSFSISEFVNPETGTINGDTGHTTRLLAEKVLNISKK